MPPPPPGFEPEPPKDDCGPSFGITGAVASEPKGITLTGRACSLDELFEVKTKGDILGTITFRPSGESAGVWSYKGKPFDAPFKRSARSGDDHLGRDPARHPASLSVAAHFRVDRGSAPEASATSSAFGMRVNLWPS